MFKKIALLFSVILCLSAHLALAMKDDKPKKEAPLTDRILKIVDGLPGLMDETKIRNTLWLIKEIKQVQEGHYRVNAAGELDPSRGSTVKDFVFRGKKQNIKTLIELETQVKTFSETEKSEFKELFRTMKDYFDLVNQVLAPEAAGTHDFMYKLTQEFCRKHNRPDSILLDWNKGDELELYRKSVTSFQIFFTWSSDLMNFLKDLIASCPKAFAAYKKSLKDAPGSTPAVKV